MQQFDFVFFLFFSSKRGRARAGASLVPVLLLLKQPANGMQSTVFNHLFATGAIFVCLASFQPVGHASDQPLQIGMLSSWAWNGI